MHSKEAYGPLSTNRDNTSRRVALVDEPHLRCLTGVASIYELAQRSIL